MPMSARRCLKMCPNGVHWAHTHTHTHWARERSVVIVPAEKYRILSNGRLSNLCCSMQKNRRASRVVDFFRSCTNTLTRKHTQTHMHYNIALISVYVNYKEHIVFCTTSDEWWCIFQLVQFFSFVRFCLVCEWCWVPRRAPGEREREGVSQWVGGAQWTVRRYLLIKFN